MASLFSPGWIEAVDSAVAAAELSSTDPLVIQNIIEFGDGSAVTYHLALGPGGARAAGGPHDDPTVTYRLNAAAAGGIADGSLDPYAEFMAGRLEVTGDSGALVRHQHLIEALQAAVASASTEA